MEKHAGTVDFDSLSPEERRAAIEALFPELLRLLGYKVSVESTPDYTHYQLVEGVSWEDVLWIAPDATGGLSSEEFVRKKRDRWR